MSEQELCRIGAATEAFVDVFNYDPWRILDALVNDNVITEKEMGEILEWFVE